MIKNEELVNLRGGGYFAYVVCKKDGEVCGEGIAAGCSGLAAVACDGYCDDDWDSYDCTE